MQTIVTCPICESAELEFLMTTRDFSVSFQSFDLLKCKACDFYITNPQPESSNLDKYYQSDNYISHTSSGNTLINNIYLLVRKFTLKNKLKLIKSIQPTGQLLDFGCGTGDFLKLASANGFDVTGIEPSSVARMQALKKIKSIFDNEKQLLTNHYDIITLWHVLEHIPNLNDSITNLKTYLKPNGTLLIAVPNINCYDAKHYKQYWAGLDTPRHLWHFSCEAMNKLAHKHQLKIEDIIPMKFDSYYVSLLSEKYRSKHKLMQPILAFFYGLKSNILASKTGQFSSLIYIVKP